MFRDLAVATAVNAQMANIIWLLSASTKTSPVLEIESAEQTRYCEVIESVIALIETEIVQPMSQQHPELNDSPPARYHGKARP